MTQDVLEASTASRAGIRLTSALNLGACARTLKRSSTSFNHRTTITPAKTIFTLLFALTNPGNIYHYRSAFEHENIARTIPF
jgi:hypothetical protein